MTSKRRASKPNASTWDKISARDPEETLTNRDVYGNQQLDRGKIEAKRSKRPAYIVAGIVGVLAAVIVWVFYSVVVMAVTGLSAMTIGGDSSGGGSSDAAYIAELTTTTEDGNVETCYKQANEKGMATGKCYDQASDVPVPDWYDGDPVGEDESSSAEADVAGDDETNENSLGAHLGTVTGLKLFLSLGAGLVAALALGTWSSKRIDAANLMHDTSDINQYENDQHIALPEEIMRKFDYFPDVGAHSAVQVSSMISHTMLDRKGLKKIEVAKRAEADVIDDQGNPVYYKGEALDDDQGTTITETKPLIDEEFGEDLFEASGLPKNKELRKRFDTTAIPYNPEGKDRDKLGKYKTVKDLINDDWDFPLYEVQRPAGAYIVDTAPVNTMVLAITRAGKGQTYIEPMLDMWSREKKPSNMVINDPKGELLVKNYVPFVNRGFQPVQFNLINPMKTDIYNPLGLAAEKAREGDTTQCATYVNNIADVFFPLDGGEDPVWPNAANNAFKRAAYGLIDYYLEEERELREHAASAGMDAETLERKLDDMWGHVTLYNCYQLFVQMTSKKIKNPEAELEKKVKAGEYDDDEEGLAEAAAHAKSQAFLWEGKAEQDMLSLYFNATEALPTNAMRTLVGNAHNALKSMAGAEKMLASVYGIAITAMSFFTDPRISTLTSGKPSQNTDLAGLSFPRRLGVRFSQNYLKRDHLIGQQAVWSAYSDEMFTQNLGKKFEHEEIIGREGWARYNFEGIFPEDEAWLKLELHNPQTNMLVRTFYFHFRKNYQLTLNGRHYVEEPVTGRKIVKNGVIRELQPVRAGDKRDGEILSFKVCDTTYPQDRLDLVSGSPERISDRARAITQTAAMYSEQPKAMFLITPPNLMSYAKLLLILVKQLFDVSADQSYMTKASQKPLYRTRYMLDELGNLQSDGNGIAGFETMLSIGLGQEQQFTLILQTLQQLRAVYGDDTDKVVQGNVSNIIFLKSTDDAMIETLEKMSGTTHKSYIDSKQVSRDVKKLTMKNEGNVSYTMSTKEEPLIKFNDMAFIAERNSIVFRAGDAPVWNRNETILPMSWRLFKDKITHPGHDYSLQTVPTLSSAMDFDVRQNQPDFAVMVDRRMKQAVHAENAKGLYQESYGYKDVDIARLDPDLYSEEVMRIVQMMANVSEGRDAHAEPVIDSDELEAAMLFNDDQVTESLEVAEAVATSEAQAKERAKLIFAEGTISKDMLVTADGTARVKSLDLQLSEAYKRTVRELAMDRAHFSVGGDDELRSADGTKPYITPVHSMAYADAARKLNESADDDDSRVYAEGQVTAEDLQALTTVTIHAEFYQFLASLPSWEHLADGEFDRAMAIEMRNA